MNVTNQQRMAQICFVRLITGKVLPNMEYEQSTCRRVY